MRTKNLRIVFIFCLVLFSSPTIQASMGWEKQSGQKKRFEVFEEQFHLVVENGLISLDSHDGDLVRILGQISKGMGLDIEFPTNLQDKVSVAFRNLPLNATLKKLVNNWGIVFSKKTGPKGQGITKIFCLAKSQTEGMKEIGKPEFSKQHLPQYPVETPPQPSVLHDSLNNSPPNGQIVQNETTRMAPHELVVRFRKDLSENKALGLIKETGASIKSHIAPLGYYVLSLPNDVTVQDALSLFQEHDAVERAEPNYLIPINAIPNDPAFSDQWSLENIGQDGGAFGADIDATEAWEIEDGNEQVIIAVVDTGVDYTHPDLSANIWHNPREIPNNGIDDDGNGYIDDTIGWDFVDASGGASNEDYETPDHDPMDRHGHGTHVAGIAAAIANNGIGMAGVAWRSKIMPLRAGYKTPSGDGVLESDDAAQAIVYAAKNGARVINLSWGDYQKSNLIEDAVTFAANNGILICAAAGNENTSNHVFPAASANNAVISVGATDRLDRKASFSNYGDWVDVFAPGKDIYSTYPGNSYRKMSGTSMATPHVSGLAALLFSYLPELSPLEAKARIMRSVDVLTDLGGKSITSGRINAYSALTGLFETPQIYSVNPMPAHEGDRISLYGDRFGSGQGRGSVVFDSAKEGQIILWSETLIVCRVPEGAQTGEMVVVSQEGISNSFKITILPKFYEETLVENAFIGKGKAQGWQADDQSWPFQLPFTFPFFDRLYKTVQVSSNGTLYFSDGPVPYSNSTENLEGNLMIAPLWDDLITNGTVQEDEDIYIHAPSPDAICIRWKAETYETGDPINVEVILYQDGRIFFNYGQGNSNLSPTIGISGGDDSRFRLASYDGENSLTRAQTILFTPHKQPFTITLHPGWNLISLPIEPSSNPINQILGPMVSNIESVWGFIDGVWKVYMPDNPSMSNLEALNSGHGYWVKARAAGVIQLQGEIEPVAPDLAPGWNLIGIRSLKALPVPEAMEGVEGEVESLWEYKDGTWKVYDARYPGLCDFDMLEPGQGYWIRVKDN